MCRPWVMHFYPGMTRQEFESGNWSVDGYVAMWSFVKSKLGTAASD